MLLHKLDLYNDVNSHSQTNERVVSNNLQTHGISPSPMQNKTHKERNPDTKNPHKRYLLYK